MIKRFIIAIVLLAILVGGIVGFNMFRDQAIDDFFANMPVANVTVSVTEAEESSWTPSIEAIGTVNASEGVDLTVETTGIVREVNFTSNQEVEQGELLLQLDDVIQQADLEVSRTQAELDRQTLERTQELQQRGVGSNVSLETAQAAVSVSSAQVKRNEAVVAQKQLRAPFAGTLGIPRVDPGQYIQPGTVVATLQALDTMRADFTVPEQQLASISIGQPISLGLGGEEFAFSGEVVGIDPKIDPASRLASVRAQIANPEGELTPGQFVQIQVEMPEEEGVIALPQTTVVTSLYGDYVYVVQPRESEDTDAEEQLEVRQVFVQVGRRSGDRVEIVSGVSAGDRVVNAGQNRLNNGTPVVIDNTVDPTASTQAADQ
ncbi:efflux RND transporter periplasmic adaptor subunit [Mesorhizobium sp. CAU 1741]|uniref:efflux RND transporter periplasmic adaptor subunit n=1 Tax=Mesorhizobium sp. CAU 1741 TaxID=3140366 RepID=UPI00325AB809